MIPFAEKIGARLWIRNHGDHSIGGFHNSVKTKRADLQTGLARWQDLRSLALLTATSDSNGSRRAILISLSAGADVRGAAAFSTFFATGLAGGLATGFAEDF